MNPQEPPKISRFRILAIDGGGIKGVFPASFLATLEECLGLGNIGNYFDLIAGTSTGGIIALGLGFGYTAQQLLTFYRDEGPRIFGTRNWFSGLVHRTFGAGKHPAKPLREALARYFGDKRLADASVRLVIPAFDANTGRIHIYKTPHEEHLVTDGVVSAVDVALATSAAPTYLPLHSARIANVDGGLWANNPTALAVVEAIGMLQQPRENISILSLGCTETPRDFLAKLPSFFWARAAFDAAVLGQSFAALGAAKHLVGHRNVFRFSPSVQEGRFALDDVAAIPSLTQLGYTGAREASRELRNVFFQTPAAPFRVA